MDCCVLFIDLLLSSAESLDTTPGHALPGTVDTLPIMARKFFVGGNFKMCAVPPPPFGPREGCFARLTRRPPGTGPSRPSKRLSATSTTPFSTPKSVGPLCLSARDAATADPPRPEIVVAPPALYLLFVRERLRSGIEVAAQNVFDKPNGAFTGEISVSQLKDSNVTWAILGHSERRTILKETDEIVASKTKYATENGLGVIWCCGESLEQRKAGKTIEVVSKQLEALKAQVTDWSNIVIAYEPIWAIGTGKVATTEQAQEVHKAIRDWLRGVSDKVADETRILYGGSVTEKNCGELSKQPDIDGFLVGGASLKPACKSLFHAVAYMADSGSPRSRRYHQLPEGVARTQCRR